jgi:signal transduction histidine kinase
LNLPVVWKNIDLIILFYQLLGALAILASVIYSYRRPTTSIDKHRAGIVLLGSFFGFFIPAIGCAIIILLGYSNITYLAILVIFFPLSIAYAIVKYKLFDIEIMIQKTLVYTGLSGVLGLAIILMIFGFNFFFATHGGWKSPGFFVLLSVFLVVALNPIKDRIQNIIDAAFFRKRYDYERTIFNLGEAMTSILNIDEIGNKIITTITDTMQIDSASFLILDRQSEIYNMNVATLDELRTSEIKLDSDDVIISCLNKYREEIFYEDLISNSKYSVHKEELLETFSKLHSSLIMPLFFKDDLVGMLSLGQKRSGLLFNTRDINLLKTLANESAIAVENANSFKLVEDYARKLEETNKELMETHLQLMQAEKMSAVGELAAGLAHEIRNPLNIIEGARYYLSTEVDHGRNTDVVDEYLEFIKNQVVRTNRLLNNLLNFSRPDDPSFNLVNLNSILENAIVLIKKQIADNEITLVVRLDYDIPEIMGDRNQLWQVLINLLINASQAMLKGGDLHVSTYRNSSKADSVYIKIRDTGEGISEENLSKIFDPFFTTKSKGSGLGLSISYKIIQSHNGNIKVDSVEGEETTFIIQLPINNLNIHDRDAEEESISS